MDNIMDTLITDRAQADVDRAKYLNSLWDARAGRWRGTPEEWAEWAAGPRGAYGFNDMNRVNEAVAYLTGVLAGMGYTVAVEGVVPAYNIRVGVEPDGGGIASGSGVFFEGDTVTVSAQAGEKYDFTGWFEAGEMVSADLVYTFTAERSRNLTAVFALKQFRVDVGVDPAGSGEATGGGVYDIDTEVTVAAEVGDGYAFTRWMENGGTAADGPEYTFTLDRDRDLVAVMTKTHVISVAASDNDGGTVDGSGMYLDGQAVTVSAVAADGYEFAGWQENGSIVSEDDVYSFAASADRELTAVFVRVYIVTLLAEPDGGGTAQGGGRYREREQITVTAAPGDDYRFVSWMENGERVSTDKSYTFTVDSDCTLTAVFEEIPVYTITATIDPAGSGTVTGAGQYKEGDTATITAEPADGYKFTGWQENGQIVSTDANYTFTVTADKNFSATFKVNALTWAASTLPAAANWSDVAYGDRKFVAIAYNSNNGAYSTDGITWVKMTLPVSSYWNSVAYGNGKFVAIAGRSAGSSYAAYSTDGINWTQTSMPSSAHWISVAFMSGTQTSGTFVAVASGYTNKAAYSTDGIKWNAVSLPSSSDWRCVAGGKNKFVSFAYQHSSSVTNKAAYSFSGNSWVASTLPLSAYWYDVAYGDEVYVAVSAYNGVTARCTDNATWVSGTSIPSSTNCRFIAFGDGKFVAVANGSSNKTFYGDDGTSWRQAPLPSTADWRGIAYGNGRFVVVGYNSNKVAYTA